MNFVFKCCILLSTLRIVQLWPTHKNGSEIWCKNLNVETWIDLKCACSL